jgi:uncharacterized protein YjbJ (UPF0337 family)
MGSEHVKGAADQAKGVIKGTTGKMTGDKEPQAAGQFDKALGSSHDDKADMRDVAQKAAKKSQS